MDSIPAGLLNGLGVVGVVLLMGWLVVTGRLVPRRTHQDALDTIRTKDAQIAEKDLQLRELANVGRTVNAVMRAIQRGSTKDHGVPE